MALGLASSLVLWSCSGKESPTAPPVVANVTVTPGGDTLATLGRTQVFSATTTDHNGSPVTATIRWHSTNAAVATVDSVTGLVTAVGNGATIIRATASGINGDAIAVVSQAVATVQVTPPNATVTTVGATTQFTAVAKDSGGQPVAGVTMLWISSDPTVAVVDTTGKATAQKSGHTTVTAAARGTPGNAGLTVNQLARHLAITAQPVTALAGEPLGTAVQVEIRDSLGGLVSDSRAAVTVALAPHAGAGVLKGSTTVNAVGGVATFAGLYVEVADSQYRLVATMATMPADTSGLFAVVPGAVDHVQFSQPDSAMNGAPITPLSVALFDRFGNFAYNATDSITLDVDSTQWSGHLVGQVTVAPLGGVAAFASVRYSSPGLFQIVAHQKGVIVGRAGRIRQHLNFKDIAVGFDHACATTPSAVAVFCWGAGTQGQLGDGTLQPDSVPRLVEPAQTMGQIGSGEQMSCGRTPAAAIYCWGQSMFRMDAVPTLASGGLSFSSFSVGQSDVCAVTPAGAAYCWGGNYHGVFGDSTTTLDSVPHAVHGGHVFSAISVGADFACGLVSGAAYCWGQNGVGRLGTGNLDSSLVPAAVLGGLTFSVVSSGSSHVCGLTSAGAAYCWGNGFAGATGDTLGFTVDSVPNAVPGGLVFSAVTSGGPHSCGLALGVAYCWGDNFNGELGSVGLATPFPRAVAGGLGFVEISASGVQTCGLAGTQVYCWGGNSYGQGGDGTKTDHPTPTAVVQR